MPQTSAPILAKVIRSASASRPRFRPKLYGFRPDICRNYRRASFCVSRRSFDIDIPTRTTMVVSSTIPTEDEETENDAQRLDELLENLSLDPENEQVVLELGVVRSIYEGSNDTIRVWNPNSSESTNASNNSDDNVTRCEVHLSLSSHDTPESRFKVLVSLPRTYPSSSPPQMQLLSRYIGAFSVDADLFGAVLRTFISSRDGVEWFPGTECIFDGLENIRERVAKWYEERLGEENALELTREDAKERTYEDKHPTDSDKIESAGKSSKVPKPQASLPEGMVLHVSEPIVDRKSIFIGRACRISHLSEVDSVLSYLVSDRRIARASHPVINAWRCRENGRLHQDNDDNGENAAGGRLAHLLQILGVDDVLVVVTRYYGGTQLGPDRFKHINQAARNALEIGGFLDAPDDKKKISRLKKRH